MSGRWIRSGALAIEASQLAIAAGFFLRSRRSSCLKSKSPGELSTPVCVRAWFPLVCRYSMSVELFDEQQRWS